MTLEELTEELEEELEDHIRLCTNQVDFLSDILNYLEELKELREKYKNVSEAYMKCNMELFRLMSEKAREE